MKNIKMIIGMGICFACMMITSLSVCAKMPEPTIVQISDIENNELFSVVKEFAEGSTEFNRYAKDVKISNPTVVPEKAAYRKGIDPVSVANYIEGYDYDAPVFKDGLVETVTTYKDINSNAIVFDMSVCDGKYFEESSEYPGYAAFAGSKYYEWGYIQLTDADKNGCYSAIYDRFDNILYVLPEGYEMNRLDYNSQANGDSILYVLDENKNVVKAYGITLKKYQIPMMFMWADRIYSDVLPVYENGEILMPIRALSSIFSADDIIWNENSMSVTVKKAEHYVTFVVDSMYADMDGEPLELLNPVRKINDRVLVPLDAVKSFFAIDVRETGLTEKKRYLFETNVPYRTKWHTEERTHTNIPLSSDDTYPDYIKDEAIDTIFDIKSINTDNKVSIGFMTDLHYSPDDNSYIRTERSVNAFKEIDNALQLDGIVLGGDLTEEASESVKKATLATLRNHFEGLRYYPVNGNHDDGTAWDLNFIKAENSQNYITKSEMYQGIFDHLPDFGVTFDEDNPDNQLYYYFENSDKKVRYIVLDCVDINYVFDENGKPILTGHYNHGLLQKQTDWLFEKALNFEEDGWTALIFTHGAPLPSLGDNQRKGESKNKSYREHLYHLMPVLDAYKNKESINQTFYADNGNATVTANYDFSGYKASNIAGVVSGHAHYDRIEYSESNIPYIITTNAYAGTATSSTQPKRLDGDKSEMAFDIYTLDLSNKRIYISRVGAGMDRYAKY